MGNQDLGKEPIKYTDEDIYNDPDLYKDEDGVWRILEGATILVEPSDKWIKAQGKEPVVLAPEPTQDDFILDLAFRLAMLEAGF